MRIPDPVRMLLWGAAVLSLCGCERRDATPANQPNAAEPEPPRPVALPQPEPPLGREQLLLAVVRARSAYAAGADDRAAQEALDGDRFELRIRFGCGTPPAEDAPANPGVRLDPQRRSVELRAAPDVDLADPIVAAVAGEGVEAAEGFWMPRPWILQPTCLPASAAPAPAPDRVGIVQFFTPDDSRVGRRGERAYSTRVRFDEGEDPGRPQGYDLVLTGRLRAQSDGRVIRCHSVDPAEIPACIISAGFDQVRLEHVAASETLAEWRRD